MIIQRQIYGGCDRGDRPSRSRKSLENEPQWSKIWLQNSFIRPQKLVIEHIKIFSTAAFLVCKFLFTKKPPYSRLTASEININMIQY